jgi:hypothetical protein
MSNGRNHHLYQRVRQKDLRKDHVRGVNVNMVKSYFFQRWKVRKCKGKVKFNVDNVKYMQGNNVNVRKEPNACAYRALA